MAHNRPNVRRLVAATLLVCSGVLAFAQNAPSTITGQDLIAFLNQTILWYRQLTVQQQLATEPSDVLFLNDNRQLADQIARLSFDFARSEAQTLMRTNPAAATTGENSTEPPSRYQNLLNLAGQADQELKQAQADLEAQKRQLETATGRRRQVLESSIAETQSEIDLRQARRDALRSMINFVSGASVGGVAAGNLQSQIEELARTLPAAATSSTGINPQPQSTAVATHPKTEPSGILGAATELFAFRRKIRALDQAITTTDSLTQASRNLLSPLVVRIKELARQGDQLANQPSSTDPKVLAQQKAQIDALTAQYKQLSGSVLPLGKQAILLDLYKRSLSNWRAAVQSEYTAALKALSLRIAVLGIILIFVLVISDIWRKATFRYIQDPRRRYQFLLLRRIVVWTVIVLVVAVAFASELGSLATFAGLLTAGVAVALQNVILSVAGYFFLIGKYGVRVGDRVQVAGVTGDVVDIGLVRLHIMEVGGSGAWARPTGRVVVFSNAVVFQANAGLFKQIPGTKFLWHEITLTLAPDSDYREVERRMMEAVNKVFEEYRDSMESQRQHMQRALSPLAIHPLGPASRVRLTQNGVEIVIRYPVELDRAEEIDDRITRELLAATGRAPKLKILGSSAPTIQPVEEPQAAR